jgi:hypothetical protein
MPDFSLLSPLMQKLHGDFEKIYFLMLPGAFALAVCIQWFKSANGTVDFLDILKRALISTLLLIAFPEISQAIVSVADGIAERIDQVDSLQAILDMASQKIETYSFSAKDFLLAFDDLFIALLTFISYWVLLFARYLNIVMYNFFWIFLIVVSPLLLLFNLFKGTSHITVNLFKSMIEVASWKIVWAILGAMLTSLSFGKMYMIEGSYITLTLMNFVIALAMIATPLIVRSLVGSGLHHAASVIGPAAAMAAISAKGRVVTIAKGAVLGTAPKPGESNRLRRRK